MEESLRCTVHVLVAVRFASWTMMAVAVLRISVDDFVLFIFRSVALLILVLVSPPHQVYFEPPPHQVCTAADSADNHIHTFLPVPHR